MRRWPPVSYHDIYNYLVMSECVDGEAMVNFKSMDSYNYFKSQKVGALYISSPAEDLIYVKGDVIPSLAVNSERHHAWVLLTTTGLDHATLTGRSGEACTDRQQQWNQGTCKNIGPKRISHVRFKRHKSGVDEHQAAEEQGFVLPPIRQYLTHTDMRNALLDEKCSVRNLVLLPGSLVYKTINAQVQEATTPCDLPHNEHTDATLTCRKCASFYDRYIDIDGEKLEQATQQQSSSKVWHDARKIRLTVSSAKKVPVKSTTDPSRFLRDHLFPSFRGNHATNHGKENEPNALRELQRIGYPTVSSGTVICPEEPWLSASPDGIIKDTNVLVEVKCPVTTGADMTKCLESGKPVCDVKLINGRHVLMRNGPRGYFMQTQLGMKCTNTKQCIFFVWCAESHILINVEYDEKYTQSLVERLKRFYFTTMLPRVVEDFNGSRLTLSKLYMTVTKDV
ncbi:hypothetical protein BaRGS_00026675 [Batillaria attramentaria]|uniref:YqaJ viral recombinase domain-containing protein n=1 Tax=Batillaria attramentaria TaxID=370345 RepID=A0ABD0K433_9CAEN